MRSARGLSNWPNCKVAGARRNFIQCTLLWLLPVMDCRVPGLTDFMTVCCTYISSCELYCTWAQATDCSVHQGFCTIVLHFYVRLPPFNIISTNTSELTSLLGILLPLRMCKHHQQAPPVHLGVLSFLIMCAQKLRAVTLTDNARQEIKRTPVSQLFARSSRLDRSDCDLIAPEVSIHEG